LFDINTSSGVLNFSTIIKLVFENIKPLITLLIEISLGDPIFA